MDDKIIKEKKKQEMTIKVRKVDMGRGEGGALVGSGTDLKAFWVANKVLYCNL